ncbi:preprotein translocase subunit SecE [Candidatus Giovannonibacteria bacterium]|nr:preprotein translocase subunit SecE [Candidatus Giovannonibacteria bacterium]
MLEKITNYFKETRQELKHVNWPSRDNTVRFTVLVIAVSIVIAIFLGLLDFIFQYLLNTFIL